MFENLRRDVERLKPFKSKGAPWYVLESLLFETGLQAVVLYRIASWFKRHRIPFFGPFFGRLSHFLTGVDIAPGAEIGPGLLISHATGLVIGQWVRIGANATLLHQVTIGGASLATIEEMPRLGDDVFVAPGVRILGGVTIGDDVFIGANSLVNRDIPAGSRVVSDAGIEIKVRPAEEGAPGASEGRELL